MKYPLYLQEKLFSSKNRTEASVGKKLKNDMLAEVERVQKVIYDSLSQAPRCSVVRVKYYGSVCSEIVFCAEEREIAEETA